MVFTGVLSPFIHSSESLYPAKNVTIKNRVLLFIDSGTRLDLG